MSTLLNLPDECKKCKYECCLSICPTLETLVEREKIEVTCQEARKLSGVLCDRSACIKNAHNKCEGFPSIDNTGKCVAYKRKTIKKA